MKYSGKSKRRFSFVCMPLLSLFQSGQKNHDGGWYTTTWLWEWPFCRSKQYMHVCGRISDTGLHSFCYRWIVKKGHLLLSWSYHIDTPVGVIPPTPWILYSLALFAWHLPLVPIVYKGLQLHPLSSDHLPSSWCRERRPLNRRTMTLPVDNTKPTITDNSFLKTSH